MNTGFPAWFLVGPTAAGKTAVAHWLARRQGFEVLSADSMLVYRGMDIGTAKPTPAERSGIPYHGIDLVDPDQPFSVGAFLDHAREAFAACAARGNRMLVAGGTGLYVRALLRGLDAPSPPDTASRSRWADLLAREGVEGLRTELERMAPGVAARMADPRNPRRLVRVLERLQQGLPPLPTPNRVVRAHEGLSPGGAPLPPLAGLWFEPDALNSRIARRVDAMFADDLLDEVRRLSAAFPVWSETARGAIGYAEALAVLAGDATEAEARECIAIRTRQLAKRQRTWYRHQLPVAWIAGPADDADVGRAAADVAGHWRLHGPHTVLRSKDHPPHDRP